MISYAKPNKSSLANHPVCIHTSEFWHTPTRPYELPFCLEYYLHMVHCEARKGIKRNEFRNVKLKDMNPQKGVSNPEFII